MRHLMNMIADVLRGPKCPWCHDRVRTDQLGRHWHLEHCGDGEWFPR